jgi:hypothetical protein
MVGGPVAIALFLFYIGIAATIPFLAGLLGFSRRIPYVLTAILTCGMAVSLAVNFSNGLKYQSIYSLLLIDLTGVVLLALELLLAFVLAHWLDATARAGFLRIRILWLRNGSRSL